jgi:quinol monooxygenase YgiN
VAQAKSPSIRHLPSSFNANEGKSPRSKTEYVVRSDQEEEMFSFVQLMTLRTSKIDEIRAAVDEWQKATEGTRTVMRSAVCQDRDNPDRYSIIVSFDSYEDAMKNSALPETDALSQKILTLSDGSPTFVNLDVIEERLV